MGERLWEVREVCGDVGSLPGLRGEAWSGGKVVGYGNIFCRGRIGGREVEVNKIC